MMIDYEVHRKQERLQLQLQAPDTLAKTSSSIILNKSALMPIESVF
jgi:hypothetical protein